MSEWKTTGCVLCAQNCGMEVLVEDNRIVKAKPDKKNPRSEGYCCRKGLALKDYQHHAERLTRPLKRVGDRFEEVGWSEALDEIADRLGAIREAHGPRSLAYIGGGGQGSHFEAAFGTRLLGGLGSRYHYSSLAQELTGHFWVAGRFLGRQYLGTIPDEHNAEVLVAIGWNGWVSHQMPQTRRILGKIKKDPERLLVAIDPRRSETARKADIHLALRPGTDALLLKAMIAIILAAAGQDSDYLRRHTAGFDLVAPWFRDFDYGEAVRVCQLELADVRRVCDLLMTRSWAMHTDLGVLMNRHSTATSYLYFLLTAICGRIGVEGGNVLPGTLMPLGSHSDERKEDTWRTLVSDFPAIMGIFPPNVLPEEILSEHPERLRAIVVGHCNPLRSYADTTAFEKAFAALDLLVVSDVSMTETAELADFVLPARSGYESWDGTFFSWNWPDIYFQMRRPVVEPEGDPRETGWIYTQLARRLGLIPEIPPELAQAAQADRPTFAGALLKFIQAHPEAQRSLPFILAETLGEVLGSAHLAALWGLLMNAPKSFRADAERAGFAPGLDQGERIFAALLEHPEGVVIGRSEIEGNLRGVRHPDGRIQLHIPELEDWVRGIDAAGEQEALRADGRFPFVLNAGRHMETNANTQMRKPSWNLHYRACTVAMNPADAERLGLADRQEVAVITETGSEAGELELSADVREGMVLIPHGFGLKYRGEVFGINVNRLTSSTHRDRFAGTPLHRYVPCRVEPAQAGGAG
ncbi:MAG: molybdopterin-dependent oxidoreductase [bacterium]